MNKTLSLTPRGTLQILGTLRPNANVLGIRADWNPRCVMCWAHRRVDISRHYTILIPNYGKIVKGKTYKSCRHVTPGLLKDTVSVNYNCTSSYGQIVKSREQVTDGSVGSWRIILSHWLYFADARQMTHAFREGQWLGRNST